MTDGINGVEARISQIESLLDPPNQPNGEFGRELGRSRAGSQRPTGLGPSDVPAAGGPVPPASPEWVKPIVQQASAKTGLPSSVIDAVIQAESGFHNNAVSSTGAEGLMQLMPGTARGLGVSNPFDPAQNITGGAEYLKAQLDRFGTLDKALAAYNAGPGAVEKFGGVPPYRETQNYVHRILHSLERSEENPG